jgi:hypothetical protein
MTHKIYKNEFEGSEKLRIWLEDNEEEWLLYPNHYLLILLSSGIVAISETREGLMEQMTRVSLDVDVLNMEEIFIINTSMIRSGEGPGGIVLS